MLLHIKYDRVINLYVNKPIPQYGGNRKERKNYYYIYTFSPWSRPCSYQNKSKQPTNTSLYWLYLFLFCYFEQLKTTNEILHENIKLMNIWFIVTVASCIWQLGNPVPFILVHNNSTKLHTFWSQTKNTCLTIHALSKTWTYCSGSCNFDFNYFNEQTHFKSSKNIRFCL